MSYFFFNSSVGSTVIWRISHVSNVMKMQFCQAINLRRQFPEGCWGGGGGLSLTWVSLGAHARTLSVYQAAGRALAAACPFPLTLAGANGKTGDPSAGKGRTWFWILSGCAQLCLWTPTQPPAQGMFRLKLDSVEFPGLVSKMNGIKQSYGWTLWS